MEVNSNRGRIFKANACMTPWSRGIDSALKSRLEEHFRGNDHIESKYSQDRLLNDVS